MEDTEFRAATKEELEEIFDIFSPPKDEKAATNTTSRFLARVILRLLQSDYVCSRYAEQLSNAVHEIALPIDIEACHPEGGQEALAGGRLKPLAKNPAFAVFRKNLIEVLSPFGAMTTQELLPASYLAIAEAFGLSGAEAACYCVAVICEKSHCLDSLMDIVLGGCGFPEVLSMVADASVADINLMLKSGRLYSSGLVRRKGSDTFCEYMAATDVGKSILSHDLYTADDVRDYVMQTVQKSDLDASNFGFMSDDLNSMTALLAGAHVAGAKGVNILLYGSPGTGKSEFAKLLVHEAGLDGRMIGEFRDAFETFGPTARLDHLQMVQRVAARSSKDVLIFDEAEDLFLSGGFSGKKTEMSKLMLNRLFEQNSKPVIWIVNDLDALPKPITRRMTACVRFKRPPRDVRLKIAADICRDSGLKVPRKALSRLDDAVALNPGLLSNAVIQVKLACRGHAALETAYKKLWEAHNAQTFPKTSPDRFEDFDPRLCNTDRDLGDLTKSLKKINSRALTFCLHGVPGTGKSLFAKWLCRELDIRPLERRASDLISPYVGMTERNIRTAFEEAKDKGTALIIDEADTFLSDRNRAERNYEVSMVNELLRALEDHPLPVFCSTNLIDNIDRAAIRRFTFKIAFKPLTPGQIDLAYMHFFDMDAPDNIRHLDNLTASDFATVERRRKLLNIPKTDPSAIATEILDEVRSKGPLTAKIGFR
jgi:SpoVK/Ycf46/Vps4 family AAA+-type ATPase